MRRQWVFRTFRMWSFCSLHLFHEFMTNAEHTLIAVHGRRPFHLVIIKYILPFHLASVGCRARESFLSHFTCICHHRHCSSWPSSSPPPPPFSFAASLLEWGNVLQCIAITNLHLISERENLPKLQFRNGPKLVEHYISIACAREMKKKKQVLRHIEFI